MTAKTPINNSVRLDKHDYGKNHSLFLHKNSLGSKRNVSMDQIPTL